MLVGKLLAGAFAKATVRLAAKLVGRKLRDAEYYRKGYEKAKEDLAKKK